MKSNRMVFVATLAVAVTVTAWAAVPVPGGLQVMPVMTVMAQSGGAGSGKVDCRVLENGEAASGTVSFQKDGQEVVQGNCNQVLSVPAGAYKAVVRLDGVLDGPEQSHSVTVKAGAVAKVAADFPTGILVVNVKSKGRRAAGMAIIRQGSRQIGTLGSGVAAHLSAGTYEIVARFRTEKKQFDKVTVEPGERVVLDASFE